MPETSSILLDMRPLLLSRILPAHKHPIPRPLAALPEPRGHLGDQVPPAEGAVAGGVVLLPRAVAADHAVRPLVGVVLGVVVALVARVDLLAAAEPKPAVALPVVPAHALVGEGLARVEAQLLVAAARACGRREGAGAC